MRRDGAAVLVTFALLVVLGLATWASWSDCDARRGTLVRGVVWWECVGASR